MSEFPGLITDDNDESQKGLLSDMEWTCKCPTCGNEHKDERPADEAIDF